jgi:peroxiredoxin Q/BCP
MARKKTPAKKAPGKKAPAKKAPGKKAPAKKAPGKKRPSKKAGPKKSAAKKSAAKKSAAKKKSSARKSTPKKSATKKAAPKKAAPKKAAPKKAGARTEKVAEKTMTAEEATQISGLPTALAPKPGMRAPNFLLPADDGSMVSLSSLKGKKVVLYFYPKDDTPGCTTEACGFRDIHSKITKRGAVVIGVSKDSVKKHDGFKKKYKLPFTLLSDPDGEVIAAYGSWGAKKFMGRDFDGILRTTVLIDEEGKIAKIYPKVSVKEHAGEVLRDLEAM